MKRHALTFGLLAAVVGLTGWVLLPQFTFASGSRVTVEGTSTVHDWTCAASQISGSLDATAADGALTDASSLTVNIPVAALDCNNGSMNGKMREALGTAPIRFVASNIRMGAPNGNQFSVEANGQLTIKGTARAQRVQAQGQALGNGRYRFTGSVPITMSQFGVTPPTAMLGTLRTGDRVTVRFDVTVSG